MNPWPTAVTLSQQAIDELYAADPDEFMDRRGALSKAAKQSGDASAAKRIAALRKPDPVGVHRQPVGP